MSKQNDYIFGYGSLVDKKQLYQFLNRKKYHDNDFCYCQLHGYRRAWNVAMNNRLDIPNYKYYIDPITGNRPDVYVVFLNIYPSFGSFLTGVLFGVSAKELIQLDMRERNYYRASVTFDINVSVEGKVWTYIGTHEAEERYRKGIQEGTAVISNQYYDNVITAFRAKGEDMVVEYFQTTDETQVPLQDLRLIRVKSNPDL